MDNDICYECEKSWTDDCPLNKCWDNGYSIMAMPPGEIELGLYNGVYDGANLYPRGEKEATAVCYMAAALVLGMFGDDLGKQRLSDVATNMLQ